MCYRFENSNDLSNLSGYIEETFESYGVLYREKTHPVTVERAKRRMLVPVFEDDGFYSDGTQAYKIVEEGSLLLDGKFFISEKELLDNYEEYKDENGVVLENVFTKVNYILAVKNPFGRAVLKLDSRGQVLKKCDRDSYFIFDKNFSKYGYGIITKDQLDKKYVRVDTKTLKKEI